MKKILVLLIVLLAVSVNAQERMERIRLKTKGGSSTWAITSTNADTSEVFDLYAAQSIQYCFVDSATGSDSVHYKVELLTAAVNVDSAFVLAQTITSSETTSGYRPVKLINVPPSRYGKIVLTGLPGNCVLPALYGWFDITGWSNAEGMSRKLR